MRNLTMMNSTFRILQLTDIHLMNESTDEETYVLIRNVINETHPDFIIITGDITMTYDGQRLLENLRDFLDSFHVFWSFVFGNHDHESVLSLDKQADILMEGKYCLFKKGNASAKGCGNHYLRIDKNDNLVALLGMLDSHNYRIDKIDGKDVWSYDYLDQSQIDDSIRTIESLKKETESFSSLFFFHIPLVDFKTAIEQKDETIVGSCLEEISCSKYDSGFFTQVVNTNTLKGIFVGHDHVCDYSFIKEGCFLAFGRCTGHYNYTMPSFKKGARIIDIDGLGKLASWVYIA